jgi:hypothetical protein
LRNFGESSVASASYRDQPMPETTPDAMTLTALRSETAVQIETHHFKFDDPFFAPCSDGYELRTHTATSR